MEFIKNINSKVNNIKSVALFISAILTGLLAFTKHFEENKQINNETNTN